MGVSSDGILAYGYDLGGEDSGWQVADTDEYGEWDPPWHRGEDSDGLEEDTEQALLVAVGGFTEPHPGYDDDAAYDSYRERRQRALDQIGVTLVAYTSGSYPKYVLAACNFSAALGTIEPIDFAALEAQRHTERWDAKLTAALDALEVRPTQARPGWLLASYYSH